MRTPTQEAAMKAEIGLLELLHVGTLSGALWPNDERALRAAIEACRRNQMQDPP